MPTTATPVVKPGAVRIGDRLPSGATVTAPPTALQRGPRKGFVTIVTDRGTLVLEPDVGFHVGREVPTAEEREEYRAKARQFYGLVALVDAAEKYGRALRSVRAALDHAEKTPHYSSISSTVLGQEGGRMEAAGGAYRALMDLPESRALLVAMGQTAEGVWRMGAVDSMGEGVYRLMPSRPHNGDCYADGTVADRPDLRFDMAPLRPATLAKKASA